MVPGIACFEQVVHGWDLARATGQDPAMPLPSCETVVSVPGGAPTIDRLIALSGRKP